MTATIEIDTAELTRIDRNIYGHFLESAFFGNIDGGVLDERGEVRGDVVDLCARLGVPNVRWPGGNFTSPYHWEDGIGPREHRPRRLELAWGSEESNAFGTDEFLAWCALVGAEPFLVHSCRDVDEAVRWLEYTNYDGDTEYTRRRTANGHPDPYRVRYWGIGNEVYGHWQMGYRPAREYAAAAREHALFMRRVDPSIKLIAVGAPPEQVVRGPGVRGAEQHHEEWTRPLLDRAGGLIDYVSTHLYAASTHLVADDYDAVVGQPQFFEQRIQDYAHLVADTARDLGVERPLALALDEWNIRHLEPASWPEPRPGEDGGVAPRETDGGDVSRLRVNRWSPRTLADALFYAGVFHVLHRGATLPVPPTMANTVNLVNANALVVARPGGVLPSASYHVWDLYQNHTGPIALASRVEGPARTAPVRQGVQREPDGTFRSVPDVVPSLDVSASASADRSRLHLAVINRHRSATVEARLVLDGRTGNLPRRAEVHDIGADVADVFAVNTLDDPDRVALRHRGDVDLDGRYGFPPHSVTLLTFRR
ncbi:alpha-L-arabinofuranosidase C-terminal domain-containing protein [Georgenia alba]|uniref:non-reducing end alpha-L-arabinofuranosidase n=1 Tax=Georgenia alba TaxID=2233858 RepID=A0ABW2Q5N3_9MICO